VSSPQKRFCSNRSRLCKSTKVAVSTGSRHCSSLFRSNHPGRRRAEFRAAPEVSAQGAVSAQIRSREPYRILRAPDPRVRISGGQPLIELNELERMIVRELGSAVGARRAYPYLVRRSLG
jgi:hypothetical protein